MRPVLIVALLSANVALAASPQWFHYGALAVDRKNAFAYGWAVDHPSLEAAGDRALAECRKRTKGSCHVVLGWSGKGCGAYRTVSESAGTAYGWGVAETREAADAIARTEVAKRSNGQPAPNFVWGCNAPPETTPAPFRKIFDAGGPRNALVLKGHKDDLRAIAVSPDSRFVATGAIYDDAVRLWDTTTGAQVRTFSVMRDGAFGVDFSPDGKTLAVAGRDGDGYLFDVATGRRNHRLSGSEASMLAVAFSPDGTTVATGAASSDQFGPKDGSVRYFDARTGGQRSSVPLVFRFGVQGLAFSPRDGHLVAVGHPHEEAGIRGLSGSGGAFSPGISTIVYDVTFSADGSRVAAASLDGKAYVFDAATRRGILTVKPRDIGTVRSVAFSPDGSELATGNTNGEIHIWSLPGGEKKEVLTGHTDVVDGLAWAPDGSFIASAGEDHTARIWPREGGSDRPYREALEREKPIRAGAEKSSALQGASDARRRRDEARQKK